MRIQNVICSIALSATWLCAEAAGTPADNLVTAALRGDLAAVKAQLAAHPDLNSMGRPDTKGRPTTALIAAAEMGHLPVVEVLLAAGADVNAMAGASDARAGNTALMRASYKGHVEVVGALLAAGAHVNAVDEAGRSALFNAAESGRLAVVRVLLAAGADTEAKWMFRGNPTALYQAALNRHWKVAQVLVEAGADAHASMISGDTPLRLAVSGSGPEQLELVKALLAVRVNVEAGLPASYKGANRLVVARSSGDLTPAEGTPLGIAVAVGNADTVRLLLDARADVNARQPGWSTPLMLAIGNARIARMLLDAGADGSARDNSELTALMLAERAGSTEVAELLRTASATAKK